jgi:hypothetical protein
MASFIILSLTDCGERQAGKQPAVTTPAATTAPVIPAFNADSAYAFVKAQTDLGPRVPGTAAHQACSAYLSSVLGRYTPHVYVQDFQARAYNGGILQGHNIIASFKPEATARIGLAAHWDSRPFADHDPDPARRSQPVMGANDGASGVGVLLETARLIAGHKPGVGVDVILFDLEDYGPPEDDQKEGSNEHWGLGSQHWSRNPHVYNYRPRYVILLDMVGAPGARFMQEGFSMYFAPDKVGKVWSIARSLGYGDRFPEEKGGFINDDHYFINTLLKVPAINIIHLDPASRNGSFFDYWHTTEDTMDKIDRETLGIVGEVVMGTIFSE